MKTIFLTTLMIVILIYSSKPVITLKPFSLSFETPAIPFAIVFMMFSIMLFQYQGQRDTKIKLIKTVYAEGVKDGYNEAIKDIKNQTEENEDDLTP